MYYFEWLIYDGRATVDYNTLARQADAQKQKNEKLPPIRIDQEVSTKSQATTRSIPTIQPT